VSLFLLLKAIAKTDENFTPVRFRTTIAIAMIGSKELIPRPKQRRLTGLIG
jgi:hypothetical protein